MHSPRRRSSAILASILRLRQPSPVFQRLSSLPVELQVRIVNEAVDDVRWVDLTTVESLMLTSRAMYGLAAPMFWRAIRLGDKSAVKLDQFLLLRPSIFDLVRNVHTKPMWKSPVATHFNRYCDIVLRLPNLEELEVCFVGDYEQGAEGWELYDRLATTVYHKLKRFEVNFFARRMSETALEREMDRPKALPLRLPFEFLDRDRLEELSFTAEFCSQADVVRISHALSSFRHLRRLNLAASAFNPSVVFPLPASTSFPFLRSLHLDGAMMKVDSSKVIALLQAVSSTLEYLDLNLSLTGSFRPMRLPKLHQLKLGTNQPVGMLANFLSSPIEVLELIPPSSISFLVGGGGGGGGGGSARANVSLLAPLKALPQLEAVISNEDIVDSYPFQEILPCILHYCNNDVLYLDRTDHGGPLPAWYDLMDDLDGWSTPRTEGGAGYVTRDDWVSWQAEVPTYYYHEE
ncbi:hypothetical protein JCM8097_003255 [Rhodosporidiobolus ruineniae]